MIYFAALGDEVKIGFSLHPKRRIRQLRSEFGVPLQLLATMEGDEDRECSLHKLFETFHLRGEWFRLVPEIRLFIESRGAFHTLQAIQFSKSTILLSDALSDALTELLNEYRNQASCWRVLTERIANLLPSLESLTERLNGLSDSKAAGSS